MTEHRKPGSSQRPGANRRPGAKDKSGSAPATRANAAAGVKQAPEPARVSPARSAAFDLLERTGQTSAHSDDLLHGPRLAGLSQVDRDLTTALVLGVLRWQIALDARIRPFLSRPDLALSEPVAIALRLGAFQLLHLERIPAHAALNESVELVRAAGHPHAAGMVNAILRKLVGAPPVRRPMVEPAVTMAERLGHPAWLVQRWIAQYGRSAAEAICEFDQQEPPCAEIFASSPGEAVPVMDAGSRLVAELAAVAGANAKRVWDCCAAPGGKTLVLAQRLTGARVVATDLSPVRLKRLGERLRRELPASEVELRTADAAESTSALGEFDLILCDVPCSGTGTLARNPEIRHRLRPEELSRQAERQKRILRGALARLTPGGRLVYSTCSLEEEECDAVVSAVCSTSPEHIRRLEVSSLLAQLKSEERLQVEDETWSKWVRGNSLRTLPGPDFRGDGFYATVLERS